jgi:hypothetical protein
MFAVPYLTVLSIIKDGLDNLKENPDHARFILGGFDTEECSKFIPNAKTYVDTAVDIITGTKGLNLDLAGPFADFPMGNYRVLVSESGGESETFFGDYGYDKNEDQHPKSIGRFAQCIVTQNLISIKETNETKRIKAGMIAHIPNGGRAYEIKEVFAVSDHTVVKTDIDIMPEDVGNTVWDVCSVPVKHSVIGTSVDSVTVVIMLQTRGPYELHYLLNMAIRYCLKHGRQALEQAGFQTPKMVDRGQINIQGNDGGDYVFASQLAISGIVHDAWIVKETIRKPIIQVSMDATDGKTSTNVLKYKL